jgi:sulfide:quinone oxidoreductase
MERFRVVICGAGIAGIEALLRLRKLAGDDVDIVLVSPSSHLDYRPLAVIEPFGSESIRRFPIDRIAADLRAGWVQESLGWVERSAQTAYTSAGEAVPYDALLLALGGKLCPTSPFMDAFTSRHGAGMFREILDGIDAGAITDLAFVVPDGPTWPLPLYELALQTAARASERSQHLRLSFVTAGAKPLAIFGGEVSERVLALMDAAGIRLYCGTGATMPERRHLLLSASGVELRPQRTVTVQRITGPDVPGIPGDGRHRFIDIDQHCRVRGAGGRIFAAGDATNSAVKHGGLSAQQADTAAAQIAHLAGCGPAPRPLHPVLHGALQTGKGQLYLTADLIAGLGWNARIDEQPPWNPQHPQHPQHKVDAGELGEYLDGLTPSR